LERSRHRRRRTAAREGELAELLSIVEQETEVATKSRMNSDYVPGIVTVLQGDELEALGVATAAEALGLVPGMQSFLDPSSSPSVMVRGLDFPFNSGNIRILLNSVPLARNDAGVNASVLLIPIEQVERIEVIRGPGSVVHGDFAFMGLVNIITRKEGTRLFASVTQPQQSASFGGRTGIKLGATSLAATVSRFTTNDAYASAPERPDDRWFSVLSAQRGGFDARAQFVRRIYNENAPPGPGLGTPLSERSWTVDGHYERELLPKLHGEVRASFLRTDFDVFIADFVGDQTKASANVVWDGWNHHSLLAGIDRSVSTTAHAARRRISPPGQPLGPLQTLARDIERDVTGFVLQDTVDLLRSLQLTLGARYDTYSDLDSRVTPRAAVVWRAGDHHIFKAQYAQGFRPPTFFELYEPPPPNVRPRFPFEVNATSELHYVYRGASNVARATLYRTTLSDIIRPGGVVQPPAHASGVELEYDRELAASWKLDANVSYVQTRDPRAGSTPRENQVSAPLLSNLSIFYRPLPALVVTTRWNHVGAPAQGRGYDLVHLTVSREDLFRRGLTLRAGVRNALDSDVTSYLQRPTGEVTETVFPGRSVWAQLSWRP
jgi:iron complex outermembrane receptor protein